MLEDRLRASATLYRQRRELVRLGVPDSDVFTDHAGFDTLDSVVRARKVFNVSSGIVVTQGFHLPRALWLARHAGLTVHGLEAGAGNGYGSKGTKQETDPSYATNCSSNSSSWAGSTSTNRRRPPRSGIRRLFSGAVAGRRGVKGGSDGAQSA
jgi:uncharacterized SAM-binding protein YcdF (DUF218 family)